MKIDDLFQKRRFGPRNVLDRLAGHGIGKKADEIACMTGLEGEADFAVGFEAANPGTVPGPRVDHDEGPARRINLDPWRRHDPHQNLIDRPRQLSTIHDQFRVVIENVWNRLFQLCVILRAPLPHDIPKQDATLAGVDQIFGGESP